MDTETPHEWAEKGVLQLSDQLRIASARLRAGSVAGRPPRASGGVAGDEVGGDDHFLPPLDPEVVDVACSNLAYYLDSWIRLLNSVRGDVGRGGPLLPEQEALVTSLAARAEAVFEVLLPDTLRLAASRLGELLSLGSAPQGGGTTSASAVVAAVAAALDVLRTVVSCVALVSGIGFGGATPAQWVFQQQLQERHKGACSSLRRLSRSVSCAQVMSAFTVAARHLGTAMRLQSQPGGGPWPADEAHWERAVAAGPKLAERLSLSLLNLRYTGKVVAKEVRAAVQAGLGELAEAVCGMLLAPERVQPLAMFGGDTGSLQHWLEAVFHVSNTAAALGTAASERDCVLDASCEAARLVQGVLAGPATQRLLLASAAAVLQQVPPDVAEAGPAAGQQRLQELIARLPGPARAAAVVLLAQGVEPLPPGLQPPPAVALQEDVEEGGWRPLEVAHAATLALSLPVLSGSGSGSGSGRRQAAPARPACVLNLLDLHLAAAALTLRAPSVPPWLMPDPLGRVFRVAHGTVRACSAAAGSDPRVCGTAYGRLLHGQLVAAVALVLSEEAQQGQPQAQAQAQAQVSSLHASFDNKACMDFCLRLGQLLYYMEEATRDAARTATVPAARVATALELQRLGATRLADELLRWLGRNHVRVANGKALIAKACTVVALVLRVANGEVTEGWGVPGLELEDGPAPAHPRSVPRSGGVAAQQPLAASRRTSRDLGAVLTTLKLARLALGWVQQARGDDAQEHQRLLPLGYGVAMLLGQAGAALMRPPSCMAPAEAERVALLAMWPLAQEVSVELTCAVLHNYLHGPWACSFPAAASGLGQAMPCFVLAALSKLEHCGMWLPGIAPPAPAASGPSLEVPKGTLALLQGAMEAPRVERLLALAAEYLGRHPRVTDAAVVKHGVRTVASALHTLLMCLASLPGTHARMRALLLGKGSSGGGSSGSGGGSSGSGGGSSGSGGGLPYDATWLHGPRLVKAYEQLLGRDDLLVRAHHSFQQQLRDGATSTTFQGACQDFYVSKGMGAGRRRSPGPLPDLPVGCDLRAMLRLCGNADCTNLGGASELDLPRLRCAGCGVARYCSRQCQAAAWRAGHKAECARLAAAVRAGEQVGSQPLEEEGEEQGGASTGPTVSTQRVAAPAAAPAGPASAVAAAPSG